MSEPEIKPDGPAATAPPSETTTSKSSESEKPAVLIVGGLGKHLLRANLFLSIHKTIS